MLSVGERNYVEDSVRKTAKGLGWSGKVVFRWGPYRNPLVDRYGFGTATRGEDSIAIVMPTTIDNVEDVVEEAMANFLHAFEHDPSRTEMEMWSSSPREEISTYIKGASLAEKLGISKRFRELGEHYAAQDLAQARVEALGELYMDVFPMDKEEARRFVRRQGFEATIEEIERLQR